MIVTIKDKEGDYILDKFIYAYDIESKDKLIKNGYDFISETTFGNEVVFLFMNNGNKINFSELKITYSNKLKF